MSLAYDPALLPPVGVAERCAVHAERIALDPGGSALWVDELVVVDVPLPWPKPVWAKDGFTSVPEMTMAAGDTGRRVRVLAAVPLDDGVGRVVTHRLSGDASFARAEHHVEPGQVADLLTVLLCEGLDAEPGSVLSERSVREFLLCTQGSHDMCCGSRGAALHQALEAIDPSFVIRRVSHTGGHRMAPTGLTLPDGRMWGMVDAPEMAGILRHQISPAAVAAHCRGWIGAEGGPAQMAERALFAELDDWDFDHRPRVVRVAAPEEGVPDQAAMVEVDADGTTWFVEVSAARAVPTIACGEPGGLPAKPGVEWRVESVTRAG